MPGPLSQQILEAVEQCSASERKVARTVLATYPLAGLGTVGELAARAGVSGPSVLRFVQRLGLDGYREFQKRLLNEVQERFSSDGNGSLNAGPARKDSEGMGISTLQKSLETTFETTTRDKLKDVVEVLADPKRRILCLGGSFSHVLANYLFIHLRLLRPSVVLVGTGLDRSVEEVIDVRPRDVLVVFDYRTYEQRTIELARAAAERKATLVSLTDPGLSPIADFSDHVLVSEVDGILDFESFVPAMAVIETLLTQLEIKLGDRVRSRFEAMQSLRTSIGVAPTSSLVEG